MRAVLTDLDRTLTGPDLVIAPAALARIHELRRAGVHVFLVTGRSLDYLLAHGLDGPLSGVVAENGALVHVRGEGPPEVYHEGFAARARAALGPLAEGLHWGRVLASGPREAAPALSRSLNALGVPHSLEFNAEEVMLLPPGVHKGTGALRVLRRFGIPPSAALAVGDGDNDAVLFRAVARGVAVANASPAARAAAAHVTGGAYWEGFLEATAPLLKEAPPPSPRAGAGLP